MMFYWSTHARSLNMPLYLTLIQALLNLSMEPSAQVTIGRKLPDLIELIYTTTNDEIFHVTQLLIENLAIHYKNRTTLYKIELACKKNGAGRSIRGKAKDLGHGKDLPTPKASPRRNGMKMSAYDNGVRNEMKCKNNGTKGGIAKVKRSTMVLCERIKASGRTNDGKIEFLKWVDRTFASTDGDSDLLTQNTDDVSSCDSVS